jgi:hypothetical protein
LFVQEIVEVYATRNLSQGGVCYNFLVDSTDLEEIM